MRIRRFCAFLVGVVFFLSGIFKLLDPVGAGLVMADYYRFFHLDFLVFSSKYAALFMALLETVTGVALITGLWRKVTAIAASAFLAFFTLLTLILVIFNPEMDCGCFGEVIHLTHMQTFLKNVVLCALAAFTVYSLMYIPLVNYTDFKPAARLLAAERFHEHDGEDMYEYVLIYEKDGRKKEFSLENVPDSTWTFVESKAVLKAGYRHETFPELAFTDGSGEYRNQDAARHKVMAVSVYDIRQAGWKKWRQIAVFLDNARAAGFNPLLITASYPEALQSALSSPKLDPRVGEFLLNNAYYADYKTLISMNRSNGGITYFDNGYLVRKWSFANMPDKEDLDELASGDITETLLDYSTLGKITFKGFLLYCFAVMLLL